MSEHKSRTPEALQKMLRHAAHFSPYYRDFDWARRLRQEKNISFENDIPVTFAQQFKENTDRFYSIQVPTNDGKIFTKFTSGSTGRPTKVQKTALHFQMNAQENRRLSSGWMLDDHEIVMRLEPKNDLKPPGHVDMKHLQNGSRMFVHYGEEISSVLSCLLETSATRLTGMTSILYRVLELARENAQTLELRLACTIGESTDTVLRNQLEDHFGLRIFDTYGAVETGIIAARCSECGNYHPADQHLHFEALKSDGSLAVPGEVSNIYVTTLYNTAMPLIRFDIGDLVETGEMYSCRRSKFSISRILGRRTQAFHLSDGRVLFPWLPAKEMRELGVQQYKMIQTTHEDVELRYIPTNPQHPLSQEQAQSLINRCLDPCIKAIPIVVDKLPRLANGKYILHESLLA